MAAIRHHTSHAFDEITSSTHLTDTEFEFDAPMCYQDLTKVCSESHFSSEHIDEWFRTVHPLHYETSHFREITQETVSELQKGEASANATAEKADNGSKRSNKSDIEVKLEEYRMKKKVQSRVSSSGKTAKTEELKKNPSANSRPTYLNKIPALHQEAKIKAPVPVAKQFLPSNKSRIASGAVRKLNPQTRIDLRDLEPVGDISEFSAVVRVIRPIKKVHHAAKISVKKPVGYRNIRGHENMPNADFDIETLISKHNKTVMKGKALFEPSRHAVKDYKMWEALTGKKYRALNVDERVEANREISEMKQKIN